METCPKCGAKFPPRAGAGYATLTVFRGGALDTKIRCLDCGHVFQPRSARFMGAIKLVVGLFVAAAFLFVIYVLVVRPLLAG